MPSPYCSVRCRQAAHDLQSELRFWRRAVAGWETVDNPGQLAWCRARRERARGLPASFFLDPANRWALRS